MNLVHTRLRHRTRPPASIMFYFKNRAHLRRGLEVTDRSNLGLKIRGIRKGESRRAISPNRDDMCATCEICLYEVYEQVLRPSLCCMLDKCRHQWHSFRSRPLLPCYPHSFIPISRSRAFRICSRPLQTVRGSTCISYI
jgi:hypothetical protein